MDRALSVTLRFPGVSLCAVCAVDCDRDKTRQQGKEGGQEESKQRLLSRVREDTRSVL